MNDSTREQIREYVYNKGMFITDTYFEDSLELCEDLFEHLESKVKENELLHSVSKCTICKNEFKKEHNMDRMCRSCSTKSYYEK